jgi:hypothetical protein
MSTPAITNAAVTAAGDARSKQERPEVAAVLLQRLAYALNATDEARVASSWPAPAGQDQEQGSMDLESPDDRSTRANEQAPVAVSHPIGAAGKAASSATASEQGSRAALADELLTLLDRMCIAVYVSDRSTPQQRMLITLDGVLPGAAAEIVRDGAGLTIRLHASNAAAHRAMLEQRDALERTLQEHNLRHVAVEISPVGALGHARRE